jgi:hypothetical protein
LVAFDWTAAGMKHTHNKKAAQADNAVKFNEAERAEIVRDASEYCKAAGVRPTPARIRQTILDNHGPDVAKAVCNGNSMNSPSNPKAAKPTKKVVRLVFGFTVAAVARALGKAGVKPAAAVEAIHKHQPKASVLAIRTFVQAGRSGLRGAPAKLTAQQLKSLKAIAA